MSSDLPVPRDPTARDAADTRADQVFWNGAGESAASRKGIGDYFAAVRRYKWLALGLTLLGSAAGMLANRMARPGYVAEATLWIQAPERLETRGPIQSGKLLQSAGWIDLLRSFAVLDSVVRQQRLYLEYSPRYTRALANFRLAERFRPGEYRLQVDDSSQYELRTKEGVVLERGTVGQYVGAKLGFEWLPAADVIGKTDVVEFQVTTPRDAARRLRNELRITPGRTENFLTLQLQGTDRHRLAAVLNALVTRFVEVASELKRAKLDEVVAILESQRLYSEHALRMAEMELERFRVETITLPNDQATPFTPGLEVTRDPVFQNFFDIKIEREQLRRDVEAVQAALRAAADSSIALEGLSLIGSVQRSPELAQALGELTNKRAALRTALQQYTREHRTVQRLVAEIEVYERATIPRLTTALLNQMAVRAEVLDARIQAAGGELRQIPPRVIEEGRLRRQVQIAERLHTNLRERYEEARLGTATTVPDVQILDGAAIPQQPVKAIGIQLVLLGIMLGAAVGVAVCILLDSFDPRVRHPREVSHGMGLAILGALPDVKAKSPVSGEAKTMQAIEALREIRLNISYALPRDTSTLLTITSPGTGDGKTFVACNLALSFADAGHRTVLIDGDTRRGTLHRLLGGSRRPGLTDYLDGKVSLAEVIQPTSSPALELIGCGSRVHAAPNLLGSAAMLELITHLKARYQVVLLDSPPLAAGVDPYLLATATGNLLLVLRTGRTDRALAEAKLHIVDRLPVRIVGAVLNGVQWTREYKYYAYLPGYEAPQQDEADYPSATQLEPV